ncbi:DUF3325 domain-containing protein [Acinetobacter albensis]|uniref:DUF3325 domain-containing protein n=1 Tax=Acinetobacter albensis TaxID=1673609 RepID=A0A1C4GZ44_9GAMM|nr:DUF3325 domain-containing protein [Acinetobacter albensis]SCC73173.1 Protein of unknown function [Acinetobacter albensis]
MSLDTVNISTACLLSYLGMFALNFSMERNAKLILNHALSFKLAKLSYGLGWCCLILALCTSILAWGGAVGITACFGIATAAAGCIIFIQSYRPKLNLNFCIVLLCLVLGLQFFRIYG